MSEVKIYLKDLTNARKVLRDNEEGRRAKLAHDRESKVKFINEEVRRIIDSLDDVFSDELDGKSDEEVTKLKNELSIHLKLFHSIPKKIEELIENGEKEIQVKQIKIKYETLVTSTVVKEVKKREIKKRKSFDSSNSNIKLHKVQGVPFVF